MLSIRYPWCWLIHKRHKLIENRQSRLVTKQNVWVALHVSSKVESKHCKLATVKPLLPQAWKKHQKSISQNILGIMKMVNVQEDEAVKIDATFTLHNAQHWHIKHYVSFQDYALPNLINIKSNCGFPTITNENHVKQLQMLQHMHEKQFWKLSWNQFQQFWWQHEPATATTRKKQIQFISKQWKRFKQITAPNQGHHQQQPTKVTTNSCKSTNSIRQLRNKPVQQQLTDELIQLLLKEHDLNKRLQRNTLLNLSAPVENVDKLEQIKTDIHRIRRKLHKLATQCQQKQQQRKARMQFFKELRAQAEASQDFEIIQALEEMGCFIKRGRPSLEDTLRGKDIAALITDEVLKDSTTDPTLRSCILNPNMTLSQLQQKVNQRNEINNPNHDKDVSRSAMYLRCSLVFLFFCFLIFGCVSFFFFFSFLP